MPDTNTVRQFISGHALPSFFFLMILLAAWMFYPQKPDSSLDEDTEY